MREPMLSTPCRQAEMPGLFMLSMGPRMREDDGYHANRRRTKKSAAMQIAALFFRPMTAALSHLVVAQVDRHEHCLAHRLAVVQARMGAAFGGEHDAVELL